MKCTQTITAEVYIEDEQTADKLFDLLGSEFAKGEWEMEINGDNWYKFIASEDGNVHYTPAKLNAPPEDCYPEEWDDDFELYEDDIEITIEKFSIENESVTDWSVSTNYTDVY